MAGYIGVFFKSPEKPQRLYANNVPVALSDPKVSLPRLFPLLK